MFNAGILASSNIVIDPFGGDVISLLHFDGSNGSTTFTDETGRVWTAGGDADISTAQSKFGGSSGRFESSGSVGYIGTPRTSDFNLTGQFTIEFFVYPPSTAPATDRVIYSDFSSGVSGAGNGGLVVALGSGRTVNVAKGGVAGIIISVASLAADTWSFVALTRDGTNTIRLFINGVLDSSLVDGTAFQDSGTNPTVWIGSYFQTSANILPLNGYLDEFRLTKGVARYTSNFTPPTRAFPNP